jgi:hypothetical protein
MTDDLIIPPPLAPALEDLLTVTERDALRLIVRDADLIEAEGEAWLLCPLSPALIDALAEFEADLADLEAEPDLEMDHDAEPSLGSANNMNQDKAWRSTCADIDLEFDGDGVADPDLEDDDPGGGNIDDEPHSDSAHDGDGQFAGGAMFDDEPSLGGNRPQASSPTPRRPERRTTLSSNI